MQLPKIPKPDEYEVIQPQTVALTFAGQEVQLKQLTMGQIGPFLRAVRGIPLDGLASVALEDADDQQVKNSTLRAMLDILAEHDEKLISAIAIATGVDEKRIAAANPDEVVMLAITALRVNADFFVQRLIPMVQKVTESATAIGQRTGGGATQSASS